MGQSYLNLLESGEVVGLATVTFEPGCCNNWHIHHKAGQTIICTAGEGWAQIEGEEPVRLTAGTALRRTRGSAISRFLLREARL